LIVNQPVSAASDPVTLSVQATGRTSTDTSVYNADGFKYQWYSLEPLTAIGTNQRTYTTSATGNYYVVVFNELGEAKSNTSSVT
jgi:hypothetical protein